MFETLTEIQRSIVYDKKGLCTVRACPGSGKTFTVAARLVKEMGEWNFHHSGLAVISFTNVAWQEVQKNYSDVMSNQEIMAPHFLGTIDSFINKYLVFPFGQVIMKCDHTPQLVGEPYSSWYASDGQGIKAYNNYFDKVTFNMDGTLICTASTFPNPFFFDLCSFSKNKPDGHINNLIQVKKNYWREGYFTQADSPYIALEILRNYPRIGSLLVNRFPFLIVDEAQDTCDTHMAILDRLLDQGLQNLFLIGDPDQAIFEWHNARPELFIQKVKLWESNSIILNENRRSNQDICNFTYKFSSLDNPSVSIAADLEGVSQPPIVLGYEDKDIQQVINKFKNECLRMNIEITPEKAAILYRGNSFYSKLSNSEIILGNPWLAMTKEIVYGKFLFDIGEIKKGFDLLIKAYVKLLYKENSFTSQLFRKAVDEHGYSSLVSAIYQLLKMMPLTKNVKLRDWVDQYNRVDCLRTWQKLRIGNEKGCDLYLIEAYFQKEKASSLIPDLTIGTIHSVKGRTFDAVLLFLKQKPGKGKGYKALLTTPKPYENEEIRIIYVAFTRPRKLLMIAVPPKDLPLWQSFQ